MTYSLSVTSADHGEFRWVIVELQEPTFKEPSTADCGYDRYEAPLNAGALELAKRDNEPYENEAADRWETVATSGRSNVG